MPKEGKEIGTGKAARACSYNGNPPGVSTRKGRKLWVVIQSDIEGKPFQVVNRNRFIEFFFDDILPRRDDTIPYHRSLEMDFLKE